MTAYVRAETPADHDAVADVVARAFRAGGPGTSGRHAGGRQADGQQAGAPVPGGQEQVPEAALVTALRRDQGAWLPRLALVAVDDAEVVGYVLGSRIHVGNAPAVALAPLAVRPDRQRQGIGQALVRRLVGEARSAGETLVLVLGDADYYSRFGFRPAGDLGVLGPYQGPAFQGLPLAADAPVGRAVYPASFGGL